MKTVTTIEIECGQAVITQELGDFGEVKRQDVEIIVSPEYLKMRSQEPKLWQSEQVD